MFVSRGVQWRNLHKSTKFERFVASALFTIIPEKEMVGRLSRMYVTIIIGMAIKNITIIKIKITKAGCGLTFH